MKALVRWIGICISALVIAVAGGVPVFLLGLIVHESISRTLWLLVSTLLAAIVAGWMSNVAAPPGSYSRLLSIVGVSEAITAAVVVPVLFMTAPLFQTVSQWFLVLSFSLLVAAIATVAASRLRGPERELRKDAVATMGLLAFALIVVSATPYVANLFGLAGA